MLEKIPDKNDNRVSLPSSFSIVLFKSDIVLCSFLWKDYFFADVLFAKN